MLQQLSHVTVCGVRNAFAGLERRICSVTSVTMANARVFRQSLDIKGNSQCLKLGSEVFTFTVFYDASNEWPYPYTEVSTLFCLPVSITSLIHIISVSGGCIDVEI